MKKTASLLAVLLMLGVPDLLKAPPLKKPVSCHRKPSVFLDKSPFCVIYFILLTTPNP